MRIAVPPPVELPTPAVLSERGALALAAAAALGARVAAPVPLWTAAAVVVLAMALHRPRILVVGVGLLAAALASRAAAGLVAPAPAAHQGEVVLLGDPVDAFGEVRVEVGVGGRRLELRARGAAARVVADRLTGEGLVVRGRVGPLPDAVRDRLARRHVVGRIDVEEAAPGRPADAAHRVANALRRTLDLGAAPLGEARPLFLGMVVGDDRGQSQVVAADFRAAGLTHLLAVSGQNVAFVLVLAAPLLRRCGLRTRWGLTLGLVAAFALLTRFEPSVLRASAMAAVACTASTMGRPASRVRILSLAVTAVLLLDPFLVRSVGFLLSVGASAGIVLLARPLAVRTPGPRWLADLVGVTLAAQVGVAPVLLPVFGGLPLASIPANVLAVPVAGPLMVWGLTAGMAAGVSGPPLAAVLHLPTGLLVGWVAGVARWAGGLPLGDVGPPQAAALLVAAVGTWWACRWRAAVGLVAGVASCATIVLVPVVARPPDVAGADGGSGAVLWRDGGAVVVVLDEPWLPGILTELRRARVTRIDVLVVRRGGRVVAGVVADLRSRVEVRLVLAPEGHRIREANVPAVGTVGVGGLAVTVTAVDPALEVSVTRAAARPP